MHDEYRMGTGSMGVPDIRETMAHLPNRGTHRWRGYDYAQRGAYFLTICTQDRQHLFGRIVDGVLQPSPIGTLAQQCWDAIPQHMPHVDIGEFVVMPNHVHGIVVIRERLVRPDGAVVVPVGADHDRPGIAPDTIQRPVTMPEHDATPNTGSPNVMNDGPDERTANAPAAQMRADHDRPLRPPADPGAPPERIMPIVPVGSLGRIVRAYKSAVTRMAYRDGLLPHGTRLWQRNYWDRVIRDYAEHERIAKYIRDNPANWVRDRFGTPNR
jgi:putative transposase